MSYLLDTHTFLWWSDKAKQQNLSSNALEVCSNIQNAIYFSVASIWEIQIKVQLGKLSLPAPLEQMVRTQQTQNRMIVTGIREAHIYQLDALPLYHRDPFDRLLIVQAIHENMTLITADPKISAYAVTTLW